MSFLVFCDTKKPHENLTANGLPVKVKFYAFHFTLWFAFFVFGLKTLNQNNRAAS